MFLAVQSLIDEECVPQENKVTEIKKIHLHVLEIEDSFFCAEKENIMHLVQ